MYGFKIKPVDDPYVRIAEKGMEASEGMLPGYLVNAFPLLKHIPEWLPGAQFKRDAKRWGGNMSNSINIPFDDVHKLFASDLTP